MSVELSTHKYLAAKQEEDKLDTCNKKPKGEWNKYLTTICILFAISSIVGALGTARGVYGLTKAEAELPVARTQAEREIQKIQQTQRDAKQQYFPVLMYNEIVKLILAGALMFAAVYLFSQNQQARKFALLVCGLGLFYNLSSLGISILMISQTGSAVNSMIGDSFANVSFETAEQKEAAVEYLQNSMITGVTIAIAIGFLIKLIYYGVIVAYLWSDDVKRIFGEDPLAYMEKEAAEKAARTGVPTTA